LLIFTVKVASVVKVNVTFYNTSWRQPCSTDLKLFVIRFQTTQ